MKPLTLMLTILLLFLSGWGNVLAAALCPHVNMGTACGHTREPEHEHALASAHQAVVMDEMEGMEMPMPSAPARDEIAPDENEAAGSLSLPADECTHCVSHSQPSTAPAPCISADQSKRASEALAPPSSTLVSTLVLPQRQPLTARTHAPPGTSGPRHVLINIFRI